MRISDRSSDVCSSDSADIRIKEREDFAAAIFLIFGRPSMFNRDVPTLAYVWTSSQLPEDAVVDSPYHPGTVRSIVLRSGGEHRSEEHTSELQSLMRIPYAVFCLKKNKQNTTYNLT